MSEAHVIVAARTRPASELPVAGHPSSPLSTGGAGVIFEYDVAATLMSRLLRVPVSLSAFPRAAPAARRGHRRPVGAGALLRARPPGRAARRFRAGRHERATERDRIGNSLCPRSGAASIHVIPKTDAIASLPGSLRCRAGPFVQAERGGQMSGGFMVDLTALLEAAEGINAVISDVSRVKVRDILGPEGCYGNVTLGGTCSDFVSRRPC
jgi:hypothetical protein